MILGFAVRFVRRISFNMIAQRSDVQGIFMRCVGFRFGNGLR